MRRALYIVFFLGVLAGGLLLYWQHSKREPKRSREPPIAETLAASPLPPPRLAPAVPSGDAGPPRLLAAIPSQDAGNDTGRLVLGEESLMQQLRDSLTRNPWLAETLAREGRHRFPDSPYSDERDMLLVLALFNEGRIDRARIETYSYFERHPGGRFTKDLSGLMGARSEPAGPGR